MFTKLFGKKNKPAQKILKEPSFWTVEDVVDWLEEHKLGEYKKIFKENEINGQTLLELTAEDLSAMKITKLGHRKKIQKLIKKLERNETSDDELSQSSESSLQRDKTESKTLKTFSDSGGSSVSSIEEGKFY